MVTACGLARRCAIYEITVPRIAEMQVDAFDELCNALTRVRTFVTETTPGAESVSFASMSVADWQRLLDELGVTPELLGADTVKAELKANGERAIAAAAREADVPGVVAMAATARVSRPSGQRRPDWTNAPD